ncbi:ATP-binding protein [Zhihengliuella flava]|uniref:Uncharacterized protein YPO0396 n=1 Tax=Zhihengliuella flava TaxID=1285193 RepID=A0A931D5Y5_9MICC|nr:ATP-binding protein [Zhihengliuella flava]MBG6085034.1 uncharacterized protein YPO0396 [Zhihengliuella flava]
MSIEYTLDLGEEVNPGQHRLAEIHVVNWGTFHGKHRLYVDRAGTLLTGHPGVGKSTLFDGIGHLFHAAPRLNESAHEASTRRDRRTTYSYLRGRTFKTADGVIAQRPGATWSAVALVYRNAMGTTTCLAALFDVPANGLEGHVGKHFLIGDAPLDPEAIEDYWATPGARRFSVSTLSRALPGFEVYDTHKTFAERFRRRLGIDHDKAFSLLRTLQNGKGLDRGVNQFFRQEVLEAPATLAAAEGAVEDFAHLRGIHRELETARAQRDALELVPERTRRLGELVAEREATARLAGTVLPHVGAVRAAEVHDAEVARLNADLSSHRDQISAAVSAKERLNTRISSLQQQHDSSGGERVAALERELAEAHAAAEQKGRAAAKLTAEAERAGVAWDHTAEGLDAMRQQALDASSRLGSIEQDTRTLEYEAMAKLMNLRERLRAARAEIDSYARRGSNIDDASATARRSICAATGLDPADVPFGGELMDVAAGEDAWRPAAEKALRRLAATLLVPGEHLAAVTRAIDAGIADGSSVARLRWVDTSVRPGGHGAAERAADEAELVTKLDFAESDAGAWLRAKVAADYPLVCVEEDAELHQHARAISRSGTLKTGRGAYERQLRQLSPSQYLLGFTNEAKIAQLEDAAGGLAEEIAAAESAADERSTSSRDLGEKLRALAALAEDSREFSRFDTAGADAAVAELESRLAAVLNDDASLAEVRSDLEAALAEREETVGRLAVLRAEAEALQERLSALVPAAESAPASGTDAPAGRAGVVPGSAATDTATVTEAEQAQLVERFEALTEATTAAEVRAATDAAALALQEELARTKQSIFAAEADLAETFREFAREFGPSAAASYGTGADAAEDYVRLYESIVAEGLPQREEEFREYFSNRSYERFSDLLQLLEEERRAIAERIEPLNQILSDVPFEQGPQGSSRLRFELSTAVPAEARAFKAELKDALGRAYSGAADVSEQYERLEALVDALDDPARAAWRDTVLDVRQHVTISCNEHKAGGEIEAGLEPGTLSGGEGQRFTSFVMGAALAYQLGLATQGFTTYGTVMIDEAFIQANSEYAGAGINALQEFGFQLLLAAPEDKVDLARHLGSITDIVKRPGSNVSGFVETGLSPAVATDVVLR